MRENPSAIKSQQLIVNALFSLLKEKTIDAIGISEICSKEGLSRPTFYNHFSSKEEVVSKVLDDHFLDFISKANNTHFDSLGALVRHFFYYWETKKAFLMVLLRNNFSGFLSQRFSSYLNVVFRISAFTPEDIDQNKKQVHDAFLSSGLVGVLELWLSGRSDLDAETLASCIEELLNVKHNTDCCTRIC